MVSDFAVEPVPYSNKAPVFLDAEGEAITDAIDRSVAENSERLAPPLAIRFRPRTPRRPARTC